MSTSIPAEVWVEVFAHISPADWWSVSATCSQFRELVTATRDWAAISAKSVARAGPGAVEISFRSAPRKIIEEILLCHYRYLTRRHYQDSLPYRYINHMMIGRPMRYHISLARFEELVGLRPDLALLEFHRLDETYMILPSSGEFVQNVGVQKTDVLPSRAIADHRCDLWNRLARGVSYTVILRAMIVAAIDVAIREAADVVSAAVARVFTRDFIELLGRLAAKTKRRSEYWRALGVVAALDRAGVLGSAGTAIEYAGPVPALRESVVRLLRSIASGAFNELLPEQSETIRRIAARLQNSGAVVE